MFLFASIGPVNKNKNIIQNTQEVPDNIPDNFMFVSKNKRFVHFIRYNEVDGCVKTQEIVSWKDPFTNNLERVQRKTMLYITDLQNTT